MPPLPDDEPEPAVRVIHGDCLNVLPTLAAGSVDAVVTDPPYGIGLKNHGNFSRSWEITGDDSIDVTMWVADWADRNRLPLCMLGSAYRSLPGKWRNILVWDKGPAVGAGGDPRTCWKRTFDLIFVRNNHALLTGRDAAVLKFWQSPNFRKDFGHHPAQKPVELMRYLIRQLVPPDGLVLDPFAGSGTTGLACLQEGRRCILIEKEQQYVEIINRRLAEAQKR